MDRRGFLKGILAAASAPAIVQLSNLMPLYIPSQSLELNEASLEEAMIAIWSRMPSKSVIMHPSSAKLLWPGVREIWEQTYSKVPKIYPELFL